MTKRDAAEKNVNGDGYGTSCFPSSCPFWPDCTFSGSDLVDPEDCIAYCRIWLKNNPEKTGNDWKELDQNKYEVEIVDTYDSKSSGVDSDINRTIRYRERKPEPEVIIKRSGGTWVARHDGVDYLCRESSWNEYDIKTGDFNKLVEGGVWKPIKEITITDEIALLRPMIVSELFKYPQMLIGVVRDIFYTDDGINREVRLATVPDLEES